MDCSLPSSSVHEILQARILEWVAIPFFRVFSNQRLYLSSALQADPLPSEISGKPWEYVKNSLISLGFSSPELNCEQNNFYIPENLHMWDEERAGAFFLI